MPTKHTTKHERQRKFDAIMQFAGIASGDTNNMTAKQIRIKRAQEKYGTPKTSK